MIMSSSLKLFKNLPLLLRFKRKKKINVAHKVVILQTHFAIFSPSLSALQPHKLSLSVLNWSHGHYRYCLTHMHKMLNPQSHLVPELKLVAALSVVDLNTSSTLSCKMFPRQQSRLDFFVRRSHSSIPICFQSSYNCSIHQCYFLFDVYFHP